MAGNICIKGRTITAPYHPPVKRSVQIDRHKTSISLEPLFWEMLKAAAEAESIPINALVARIDAERIKSSTPPGLASAIRVWLVANEGRCNDLDVTIIENQRKYRLPPT